MIVYHSTLFSHAVRIWRHGFRDGTGFYGAFVREPFSGVWLCDRPFDATYLGPIVFTLDIPTALFEAYEWVNEEGDLGYRESLIPAARVNQYSPPWIVLDTWDEEADPPDTQGDGHAC